MTTPEEPVDEEQPPPVSDQPCTSVWPGDESITCELFLNHFDFRLPHTRHTGGTVYEWE